MIPGAIVNRASVFAGLIVALATGSVPVLAALQVDEVAEIRAAMEKHAQQRPRFQYEIHFHSSYPDDVRNAEDGLRSIDLAIANPRGVDPARLRQLRITLAEQLEMKRSIVPGSFSARVREAPDRLLILSVRRSADKSVADISDAFEKLPEEFDPRTWRGPFSDRIYFEIHQFGGDRIGYVRDDQMGEGIYQWVIDDPETADASLATGAIRNFAFVAQHFPFTLNVDDKNLVEHRLHSLLGEEGDVARDEATGNLEVTTYGPEEAITLWGGEDIAFSWRFKTRMVISPEHGHLPLSIARTIEYWADGVPVEIHPDWQAVGEFWQVTHANLDGYYYPSEVVYERRVVSSDGDETPVVWKANSEYADILRAPKPTNARVLCTRRCVMQIANLINENDAPPLPERFLPPEKATVIDRTGRRFQ